MDNERVLTAQHIALARAALEDVTAASEVGEQTTGTEFHADTATVYFSCTSAAYPAWRWAATLLFHTGDDNPTVIETHLVSGDGSLLAPEWVPWADAQPRDPDGDGHGDDITTLDADGNPEGDGDSDGNSDARGARVNELGEDSGEDEDAHDVHDHDHDDDHDDDDDDDDDDDLDDEEDEEDDLADIADPDDLFHPDDIDGVDIDELDESYNGQPFRG